MKSISFKPDMVRAVMTCARCGHISAPYPCERCGSTMFLKTQTRRLRSRLQPGGVCYVRETWTSGMSVVSGKYGFTPFAKIPKTKPDGCRVIYRADEDADVWVPPLPFRPSIHMPRWASRLFIQIDARREQELQDITEQDALDEGCTINRYRTGHEPGTIETAKIAYERLWERINSRTVPWSSNPYVVALTFHRIEKPLTTS